MRMDVMQGFRIRRFPVRRGEIDRDREMNLRSEMSKYDNSVNHGGGYEQAGNEQEEGPGLNVVEKRVNADRVHQNQLHRSAFLRRVSAIRIQQLKSSELIIEKSQFHLVHILRPNTPGQLG
jgi:hypothetical protein